MTPNVFVKYDIYPFLNVETLYICCIKRNVNFPQVISLYYKEIFTNNTNFDSLK